MKKKNYNSLEEINTALHLLSIQREIHLEELKLTKHQLKEDLSPANWISTALTGIKKYGVLMLLRKIIK
ncbi:DUF6327 family protein [Algibacter sp. L4_22]|uniref:DUF6327 family protein n=1 Tax=Algibacter sp. L4_22 TaxID=2942477 RepID=UPI00201B5519|nr:DUF6327 family protein [Algibacter sp. L4_22]MCL5127989.1 DUF6327 family protein [Algibacter sp. L4_22]